jgi:hypothetical protein
LVDVVTKFATLSKAIHDEAIDDLGELGDVDIDLGNPGPTAPLAGDRAVRDGPMRVVLMGRTMAGKSSLLSALTGAHRDRVGDGRQRFSRDVFGAPIMASSDIEIVDTPGVGARDGAEDFEKAFAAACNADLILWVASSDSIQEETARALRLLGLIGKPIVVALNCRQSLEGVGRLNLLRFPERVFGNRDGLVDEIKRHMAASGVTPLGVVYLHALAATSAHVGETFDEDLHKASRVADLVDVLLREHDSHRQSRRVIRLIDSQRLPADEATLTLAAGAQRLSAVASRNRAMTSDLHTRLARVTRSTEEAMLADIESAVGQRRDWHLTVTDFGESLPSAWDAEVAKLKEDLDAAIERHLSALTDAARDAVGGAEAEWSPVAANQFALGKLRGFEEVWGNRVLRAGIGLGGGVAAAWGGAQLGGMVGAAGGPLAPFSVPIGIILGGLIGFGASFGLEPLKNLVGQIFLGKDGVLRKRREQVASRIGPLLDEISTRYSEAVVERLSTLRESIAAERFKSEDRSAALDRVAARWTQRGEDLQSLIRELDRETTTILLRVAGRERLARSVRRSTRLPGICVLTEFEPTAFWEAWLFPPDIGERLVPGKPAASGGEAVSSLTYALGLLESPARLTRADPLSALLHINADVPASIAQGWADGLTQHLGAQISIETTERVGEQ